MRKPIAFLSVALLLLLGGCKYETALSVHQGLTLDPAVIGVWQQLPEEGKPEEAPKRMVILPFSDSEYLVDYAGIYFSAYPVRIGALDCVQVEVLGSKEGPLGAQEKRRFDIWSYRLENGVLTGSLLNHELVSKELTERGRLRKAFLENIDEPQLFTRFASFRKVPKEPSGSGHPE